MKSEEGGVTKIFIASSHRGPHVNRIAPTAYAFVFSTDLTRSYWGVGGAKEAQEMLAQGLIRAVELALLEDEGSRIDVIVPRIGFQKYLTEFVPLWRSTMATVPGFSRNNIRAWQRLHELYLIGEIVIRTPIESERGIVERVRSLARDAASKARADFDLNHSKYAQAGVLVTDEDSPAPIAP